MKCEGIKGKKVFDGSVRADGYVGVFGESKQVVVKCNSPWSYSDDGFITYPFASLPNIIQQQGFRALFEDEKECLEAVYTFAVKQCHNRITKKECKQRFVRKVRYSVKMEEV